MQSGPSGTDNKIWVWGEVMSKKPRNVSETVQDGIKVTMMD